MLFEFLGRVLGKALFEGVVVQPQFARFFLAKLLHKPTYLHEHLPYLDMVRGRGVWFVTGVLRLCPCKRCCRCCG